MQVVIPMSGYGERFRRAGYAVPKPLIEVDGKPIIAHVVDLFPQVERLLLICNREHLDEPSFRLAERLRKVAPSAEIVAIAPHRLGPVHAVLQAAGRLDRDMPTIVNYCDFACIWDFARFRRFIETTAPDGAVVCYRGFHPHMLSSTNYAYVREREGWIQDIQEKQPFTRTPMQEFASSGTYYFASGALALAACQRTVDEDISLDGEYYVSLAYKPLLADRRRIAVYEIQHFMQWGAPEDLAEYRAWSAAFRRLAEPAAPARQAGATLVPMAGSGSRFAAAGQVLPKPLIPVSGRPMALQAVAHLPEAERRVFVLRRDLPERQAIAAALEAAYPAARLVVLEGATDGQARTCLLALDAVAAEAPLTIAACDTGALYDTAALEALLAEPEADVVVWAARGHAPAVRRPEMYGWIDADEEGRIRAVSVKTPLAEPRRDPIIIGTFSFRRAADFRAAAERMIERRALINGEYYVDTCINDAVALGLDCRIFEIDHYLCWGTPEELKAFEYWQSCFEQWPSHPYALARDVHVPAAAATELAARYRAWRPYHPKA